jgi:hypothetical protein
VPRRRTARSATHASRCERAVGASAPREARRRPRHTAGERRGRDIGVDGQHRRRREICGHVPANIGVDGRAANIGVDGRAANIGVDGRAANIGVDGPGEHRRRCEMCMHVPDQHRRRRLLAYLKRVLATPAVYLRSFAARGARRSVPLPAVGASLAACGARRSAPLPALGASVAGWRATTLGAAAGDRGFGCGSGLARR